MARMHRSNCERKRSELQRKHHASHKHSVLQRKHLHASPKVRGVVYNFDMQKVDKEGGWGGGKVSTREWRKWCAVHDLDVGEEETLERAWADKALDRQKRFISKKSATKGRMQARSLKRDLGTFIDV